MARREGYDGSGARRAVAADWFPDDDRDGRCGPVAPGDVLVRIRAASLSHTDLEAIEGALAVKLTAVLGHDATGEGLMPVPV